MSEPITYWKWTRDGMVVAACPELQDGLYVIRERYDALQAKVRELEERLSARETIYLRDQARIHDLEAKLSQTEYERDEARTVNAATVPGTYWASKCREAEKERDQLRARVGELEEATKIESAWLIEHEQDGQILYLTIEHEMVTWTPDSFKALRFARRQDAEMFALGEDCDRIAQHRWG